MMIVKIFDMIKYDYYNNKLEVYRIYYMNNEYILVIIYLNI